MEIILFEMHTLCQVNATFTRNTNPIILPYDTSLGILLSTAYMLVLCRGGVAVHGQTQENQQR